ncbi:hypothetical protein B0H10DRAFT_2042267 [Mycena sp. CBHHK59/15]|nr:hypothetical protein B0H10DRAFT_2042267 [Mycena sp. CBHHK59/15]
MRARGADPTIAKRLETILKGTGIFSQVNVRGLECRLNGGEQSSFEHAVGCVQLEPSRNSPRPINPEDTEGGGRQFFSRFAAQGLTEDLANRCKEELDETSGDGVGSGDIYLVPAGTGDWQPRRTRSGH